MVEPLKESKMNESTSGQKAWPTQKSWPAQKSWEKERSLEDFQVEGEWLRYPFLHPFSWVKCPPPSGMPAIEVLLLDGGTMHCVLVPINILIMFFLRVFTDIHISVHLHGFWGFAILFFLYVVHYWLIKWYPYIKRINKFFALFLVKIIPLSVAFEFCSWWIIPS